MLTTDIFHAVQPCFKSIKHHAKVRALAKGITCVALGLRASHLMDIAHLNLNQAKQLLQNLQKIPICKETILLIQFKDRFTFLCNKKRMNEHYKETLNAQEGLSYIAVEGKEPVKHETPPIHLVNWLKEKLQPQLAQQQSIIYFDKVPAFMVALNGWFLEYPIIYTTHSADVDPEEELDEWEVTPNCLGSRTLNVLQACILNMRFIPSDNKGEREEDAYVLFSFSCPEALLDLHLLDTMKQTLKLKIDQRLDDLDRFSFMEGLITRNNNKKLICQIKEEKVSLDRFAL